MIQKRRGNQRTQITYKELKLNKETDRAKTVTGTQITYKELKQQYDSDKTPVRFNSTQITYKEFKHTN